MVTKTSGQGAPENYDPSQFPAFAVTVDVVILTLSEAVLRVLLVCRGESPFEGMWAVPGGFKRPNETLDEAAERELAEETAEVLNGKLELAFDHEPIVRDALERIRMELELSGIATAFVGTTFTLAELRAVYEAVWGVQLDAANFRRSIVAEEGWVVPTGRRARPGAAGGRPAELHRAGRAWRHGGPIHKFQREDRK